MLHLLTIALSIVNGTLHIKHNIKLLVKHNKTFRCIKFKRSRNFSVTKELVYWTGLKNEWNINKSLMP